MTYSISIGEPEVVGSRVEVDVTASRRLRRFLSDDTFWVEYDESVEQCPDGILVVPAVVTLAPVAWAAGATITVDEINSTFAESLPELFSAYQEQYPSIFTEEVDPVQYSQVCDYEPSQEQLSTSSATLFSGGVDSLTCYLNHQDENPALFTIHGTDLSLEYEQGWERIRDSVEIFSESENVHNHMVKSNFREILNYTWLNHHFVRESDRHWWVAVHFGTGLPALCAPVTFLYGYSRIYQGSGYTIDPDYPTAQPSFVHRLKWGQTGARITERDMTRQDKVGYLADNLNRFDTSISIRSCYTNNTGQNCSECAKCRRTILGLCVEGINPNAVGYEANQTTLDSIRDDLNNGNMTLEGIRQIFWQDIQHRAQERKNEEICMGDSDFFDWFRSVDLSKFSSKDEGEKPLGDQLTEATRDVILSMPYPIDVYLWSMAKPVKHKLPF